MLTRSFDVFPAIDVLAGRVVRLSQGRRDAVTLEGGDPLALAARYEAAGARLLHVVDLDGAFSGAPTGDLVRRRQANLLDRARAVLSRRVEHDASKVWEANLDRVRDRLLAGHASPYEVAQELYESLGR